MATGDGYATCSECENQFSLPEEASKRVKKGVVNLGQPKTSAIQRNIVSQTKNTGSEFGKVEKIPEPFTSNTKIEEKVHRGERRKRLKKRNKATPKVVLRWLFLWLATVGIILFVISRFQIYSAGVAKGALTIEERLVGEEREFYKTEYPKIERTFRDFLGRRSVNQMSELVLDTDQVERKMARHFRENVRRTVSEGLKPSPVFWNVAFEESPGFVEVAWDGGVDGFFEGVFVKVGQSWKIDWEHYERYSSESWTVFNQQIGGLNKGLFRVYIEKVSEGEGEDFQRWMKVRIIPPYSDEERGKLEASDPIMLEGDDELSLKISRLFIERSGQSEGYSQLWERDSRKLRRATVELEWVEDSVTGEERMVIKDVLAEHWRGLETIGEPAGEKEDESRGDE